MSDSQTPDQAQVSTSSALLYLTPSAINGSDIFELDEQLPHVAFVLETLPPEILYHIVGLLDVTDLRNIRMCSRVLAHNMRPLLCRNINVTETVASFERMISLCSQNNEISRGVRSLTYIPLSIRRIEHGSIYRRTTRKGWNYERDDRVMPFDEYLGLLKDRSFMANNMMNVEYFVRVLRIINPLIINIILPNENGCCGYHHLKYDVLPSHTHFLQ